MMNCKVDFFFLCAGGTQRQLSFALFAELTMTVAPGDTCTQLPTQPTRPPSKLLSLQVVLFIVEEVTSLQGSPGSWPLRSACPVAL